ncbi:MAG TPA: M23 family metallopeptidase [bacterium]|nr:M23 family metallopeptidase [bacterium]
MAFIGRILLNIFVVPFYRLYALINRKISASPKAGRKIGYLLTSRYVLPALFILIAVILTTGNLTNRSVPLSSSELVGKTLLSQLITGDTVDAEQFIEDYPNYDITLWRKTKNESLALLRVPLNLFTNESPKNEIPGSPTPSTPARTSAIAYTVQNGDTISGIARRFNISANTILWENNLSATSVIQPGDKLTILPTSGVSHSVVSGQTLGQIASLYGVTPEQIMASNGITNANQIRIGARLVIPGGKLIAQGPKTTSRQIAGSASKGLNAIKKLIPGPSAIVPAGARMVWPTTGHNITQYFSWRHTGVDVANRIGTAIYAADDGVVTTTGWNNGGYGNQIIINHGGGKTTRYAHLSAFGVNVGQKVSKGQYIAAMGSTGRSTGPHLHFEVILNGRVVNPLNYVR